MVLRLGRLSIQTLFFNSPFFSFTLYFVCEKNNLQNRYTKNRNINGRGIRKPDAVVRSKNVLSKNYNKPLGKDALGNAGTSSRNDHR